MSEPNGPILLVCADAALSQALLDRLAAEGFGIVGPAPTAGLALVLAAQTATPVAVLAGETCGRRSAQELATELSVTWGVQCHHLAEAEPSAAAPGRGLVTALRAALEPPGGKR